MARRKAAGETFWCRLCMSFCSRHDGHMSIAGQLPSNCSWIHASDVRLAQVCLTTALARRPSPDARTLYPILRALNPAPYAAWLSFGPQGPQVGCPSPPTDLEILPGWYKSAEQSTARSCSLPSCAFDVDFELSLAKCTRRGFHGYQQ